MAEIRIERITKTYPGGKAPAVRDVSLTMTRGETVALLGAAMASHFGDWSSSTLHIKLALVVLVAILVGVHIRRPTVHALDGAIFLVSLAIVWLGVALAH